MGRNNGTKKMTFSANSAGVLVSHGTRNHQILLRCRPSLRRTFLLAAIYIGAIIFGCISTGLDPRFYPVWTGAFAVMGVLLLFAIIRHWCVSYEISPDEIRTFRGVLTRHLIVVPIKRVTEFDADQGLLERLLGIVDVCFECPGGPHQEIRFEQIAMSNAVKAERIYRELAQGIQAAAPAGKSSATGGSAKFLHQHRRRKYGLNSRVLVAANNPSTKR
ncbi:MAG TPA: PH domain-containing protein [Oligoflexia bacterium]|nr:PH domain-containing protein [Oligoflexia bacterium]